MRAIPAFREPAPRVELMDELGVDRTLMFPTLASLLEERMRDDPELLHAVVHALNEWMYETWQFDYEGRIFSTPVITLPIVERAIEELEWCLERGARTVLIRPAPVPGYRGSRSFAYPEFDPFSMAAIIAAIENGGAWVPGFMRQLEDAYRKMPQAFSEDPVEAFKRNIYVSPFHEDDISELVDLLGADHLLFGSDYPHPEGLAEPCSYLDHLPADLSQDDVAKIMGGNLAGLMRVDAARSAR